MNPTQDHNQTKEEQEQQAWDALNEIEIKLDLFNHEAKVRLERVRRGIEETNHHLNVATHELHEEMAHGMKKIRAAEKAIFSKEDF